MIIVRSALSLLSMMFFVFVIVRELVQLYKKTNKDRKRSTSFLLIILLTGFVISRMFAFLSM